MHIVCTAVVDDERQRNNLCDCVKILGGMPTVAGNTVSVEYMGDDMRASQMVTLFEEYANHELIKQK